MKKIVILIILLIPLKVYAISASSYIVMDTNSSRVLEGKNINQKKLIASTTKIMTAIVALENSDINKEIIVSNEVLKAYGSAIYIEVGEKIKIIDLLYGLMLRSGNDAAIEIAQSVSGSMEEFTKLMNEKAKSINMNNTLFINNHGLEDKNGNGNTSTAYDMALLMRYALNNEMFKKIIKTDKYSVTTNYKTYIWNNKNKLLDDYKYCIGGKTGFTKKAKRTLVTAASKNNKNLIIVTLNDPDDFDDHKYLYEKNFKKYKLINVVNKNNFNVGNVSYNGKVYIKEDFKMLVTNDEKNKIIIDYIMNPSGNYQNDEIVGNIKIKLDNDDISDIPIFLKVDNKKSILQKIIDFLVFWK